MYDGNTVITIPISYVTLHCFMLALATSMYILFVQESVSRVNTDSSVRSARGDRSRVTHAVG